MADWEQIVSDLRSEDIDRAVDACDALDRMADEARLPKLHELLLLGEDFFVREAAAIPVARLEGLRSLPMLLRALWLGDDEGHDNDTLQAILGDLVRGDPGEAARLLLPMLRDPSERGRASAAWLLGYASDAVTPEPLLNALRDPAPGVRSAAAGALGSFARREGVFESLAEAVRDDDEQVRRSAAGSLGDLGDRRAAPILERLREVPSEWTRAVVEDALSRLCDDPGTRPHA